MKPQILQIDSKFRLTIPSEHLSKFEDRRLYGSLLIHSLLVSNVPYEGEGLFSETIDTSNRVLLGADLLELIGVGRPLKREDKQVIWVPCMKVQREVEFLLLFGVAGRETWRRLLENKTLVRHAMYSQG